MKAINMIFTALAAGLASVPSIGCDFQDNQLTPIVSRLNGCNNAITKDIVEDLRNKSIEVKKLTKVAQELYFSLLSEDTSVASQIVMESGKDKFEHCEMFIRLFECAVRESAEENKKNEYLHGEILKYWRSIAKARYEISRLNNFVKQLTTIPKTYESDIDFVALKELAKYATGKVISGKYNLA